MHPWEYGRYTFKEFYWQLKNFVENEQARIDMHNAVIRESWEQTRWSVMKLQQLWGSKNTSPYRLIQFPWDPEPDPPPPKGSLLGSFPKKLKK